MTATAFRNDHFLSCETPVSRYVALDAAVEKDRLVLMVAIMAPLSGLFWSGIGWFGYRAAMALFS